MGLQSGSSHVALWLFTLATFAVAMGALSLAVTVGGWPAGQLKLTVSFARAGVDVWVGLGCLQGASGDTWTRAASLKSRHMQRRQLLQQVCCFW